MTTAVDSSVLIDVLQQNDEAIASLARAAQEGQLVIGEIVYAELCAGMPAERVDQFLEDYKLEFVPSGRKALALAGQLWRDHPYELRKFVWLHSAETA